MKSIKQNTISTNVGKIITLNVEDYSELLDVDISTAHYPLTVDIFILEEDHINPYSPKKQMFLLIKKVGDILDYDDFKMFKKLEFREGNQMTQYFVFYKEILSLSEIRNTKISDII
jgi:hypothetical protein